MNVWTEALPELFNHQVLWAAFWRSDPGTRATARPEGEEGGAGSAQAAPGGRGWGREGTGDPGGARSGWRAEVSGARSPAGELSVDVDPFTSSRRSGKMHHLCPNFGKQAHPMRPQMMENGVHIYGYNRAPCR